MNTLLFDIETASIPKILLSIAMSTLIGARGLAGDWPQLLGEGRNGWAAEGEKVPSSLQGSLTPVWEIPCGQGYAGVAIAKGKVALFDFENGAERLRTFSLTDGTKIWETSLESSYQGGINPDLGPRCVPSIHDEKVVTYGASGQLSSLSLSDGKVQWTRAMRREYKAEDGYFGAGSSPLVLAGRVLVAVGGKKNGGIVSVDLNSGKTIWGATDAEASYSSPILLPSTAIAPPVVFVSTRLEAYGIDIASGKVRFSFPFGQRGPTVNAATPICLQDGSIFLTASYGIGSYLARPAEGSIKPIYKGDMMLSSQYSTPVRVGSHLYASDGREDLGATSLKCIDPIQRDVRWVQQDVPVSHLIAVNDRILAVSISGRVLLFRANPDRFELLAEGELPNGIYRAMPALSQGTLVVRDCTPGRSRIMAFR